MGGPTDHQAPWNENVTGAIVDHLATSILFSAIEEIQRGGKELPLWLEEASEWQFRGRLPTREDNRSLQRAVSPRVERRSHRPRAKPGSLEAIIEEADSERLVYVDVEHQLVFEERNLQLSPSDSVISTSDEDGNWGDDEDDVHDVHDVHDVQRGLITRMKRRRTTTSSGHSRLIGDPAHREATGWAGLAGSSNSVPTVAGIPGIQGDDDRQFIWRTKRLPFRKVAALGKVTSQHAPDPSGDTFASAAFVGPRVVATAAHNVKKPKGALQKVFVVPAKSGIGNSTYGTCCDERQHYCNSIGKCPAPYGSFAVKGYFYPTGWDLYGTHKNDWALLVIAGGGGHSSWFGARNEKQSEIEGKKHMVAGYPSEESLALNSAGEILRFLCANSPKASKLCGDYMYAELRKVGKVTRRVIKSEHDGTKGQSGSGLVRLNKAMTSGRVVGVLAEGGTDGLYFRRFTYGVMKKLCKLLKKYKSNKYSNPKC